MLKFIIIVLFLIALYLIWRLWVKHKLNSTIKPQRQESAKFLQNDQSDDELPEKTKMIKKMIAEERQKNDAQLEKKARIDKVMDVEEKHEEIVSNKEDQYLFDAVAKLFFEQSIQNKDINQANKIQQDLLNKMPMNTQTQITSFDFGEWSIFWHYHDQSLEYYVGRYGIFYAHVDHEGTEHKAEFKDGY